MSKLYVTNLVILDPNNYTIINNGIKSVELESIIVKRVPFGYEEVFTKTFFSKQNAIVKNDTYNNDKYKFKICSPSIVKRLRDEETVFLIDKDMSFPLREAEEKDAQDYIAKFDSSTLKRYIDKQEEQERAIEEEHQRQKRSRNKAKVLIKEMQKAKK